MMVEDHLRKCLSKTSNKPYNPLKSKYLPKSQHSAFGDFPKEYMPKKKLGVTDIDTTLPHEQSIAATGTSKLTLHLHI
jgi:hypothetical protein